MLPGTDRQQAARAGNDLIDFLRAWPTAKSDPRTALRLNVGVACVALPPRNFSPHVFIGAAQRCLFAARATGGQGVKSIEV